MVGLGCWWDTANGIAATLNESRRRLVLTLALTDCADIATVLPGPLSAPVAVLPERPFHMLAVNSHLAI